MFSFRQQIKKESIVQDTRAIGAGVFIGIAKRVKT
jgi:hypothetical protein